MLKKKVIKLNLAKVLSALGITLCALSLNSYSLFFDGEYDLPNEKIK